MNDQTLFSIFFSAMVVNNFTLAMFLGLCPFMGVSARVETALRMGLANIFVLVLTSLSAWILNTFILETVPYLRIISFIIVVASLVQIVEMMVKKLSPTLFRQLGIFLPLMTTNCAIFGLAIFQTNRGYGFLQGITFAVGAGLGLTPGIGIDGFDPRVSRVFRSTGYCQGHRSGIDHRRYAFDGFYGLCRTIIVITAIHRP